MKERMVSDESKMKTKEVRKWSEKMVKIVHRVTLDLVRWIEHPSH